MVYCKGLQEGARNTARHLRSSDGWTGEVGPTGSRVGHRHVCEPERWTARTMPKKFRYRRWGNAKLDAGLFPHNNRGCPGWRRCTTGRVH
jgi:hypothetical protein